MANIIMFGLLSVVIICSAIFSVFTKRIMRASTGLLFVLFAISGLYFLLDYTYLGAVQLSIYAGAITMIYIFAINLVGRRTLQGFTEQFKGSRVASGLVVALVGFVTVVGILLKNSFLYSGERLADKEFAVQGIGEAMVGSEKYQYVLPFEFISVFLLACIIGGLLIARENKEEEKLVMVIPIEYFFVLSALLFFIGFFGFVTRRNLIAMLISVELILNAVDLQFAAFNRLLFPMGNEGMFMTLFSIGVSAAESAVAMAIIINVYRNYNSDSVNAIKEMKN